MGSPACSSKWINAEDESMIPVDVPYFGGLSPARVLGPATAFMRTTLLGGPGEILPLDTENTENPVTSQDFNHQLLPRIANDITVNKMVRWLSWGDVRNLSSVSPGLQEAVGNGWFYDARVRSHSAEVLAVVVNFRPGNLAVHSPFPLTEDIQTISLYSMRDQSWYELPPIPGIRSGVPLFSQCVALNGKIYVLGGQQDNDSKLGGSTNVYIMDLALQKPWQKGPSMRRRKQKFGASVIGGKIFVSCCSSASPGFENVVGICEVYDPKLKAWNERKYTKSFRDDLRVRVLGDRYFLNERLSLDLAMDGLGWLEIMGRDDRFGDSTEISDDEIEEQSEYEETLPLEVYNTVNYGWRVLRPLARKHKIAVFTACGKLHMVTQHCIRVYDTERYSWMLLQPCSFPGLGSRESVRIFAAAAMVVGDELLLQVRLTRTGSNEQNAGLFQSKGFGNKNKEIVWEQIKCSSTCGNQCVMLGSQVGRPPPVMFTIEL